MGESRRAWSKVGEHFGSLGDNLKGHGAKAASEAAAGKPDTAAITEAFNALGQAIDKAAASVAGAVKDPAVRADAKNALNAMGDALNVTFAEAGDTVGEKVKSTFGSGAGSSGGGGSAASGPASGDSEAPRSGS
ncbi:MAG TPA: hypothetical protein VFF40_03535 [Acidimicrobiia bacterium]|nr:hypothetical protein [Acidimicrobiia bacterium]